MLKKIVLASISVLFLLGMGVFAADVQVDYHVNDISQGIININGTLPYNDRYPWVTVILLNPSYNEGNIEGADFNEAVNCIKETRLTKADDSKMGSFNVDMQLQTPQSGTYTALINYYNAGSFASVSVEFIADEEFKGVCNNILQAKEKGDLEDLKQLMSEAVVKILGIRASVLKDISVNSICEQIINKKDNINMTSSATSIRQAFETEGALLMIKSQNGAKFIRKADKDANIRNILSLNNLRTIPYDVYKDALSTVKDSVANALGGKTYPTLNAFNDAFECETLKEVIKKAENYLVVRNVMSAYKTLFAVDYESEYNKLTATQKANAETLLIDMVKGANHRDIDEVASAFLSCIRKSSTPPSSDTGKGKGSGGSGGSGGKTVVQVDTSLKNQLEEGTKLDTDILFTDISSVPWAVESINALAKKNIVSGRSKMEFEPNAYVTREEFTKMAVMAFDISADVVNCDFDDVLSNSWYYEYVATAYAAEVIKGVTEQFFGSGLNITREDIAVILYRVLEKRGKTFDNQPHYFDDDNEISDYAKNAVRTLSGAGAINGTGSNRFSPRANATRAEAAKMIYSLMNIE